jgi:hypothetical protein
MIALMPSLAQPGYQLQSHCLLLQLQLQLLSYADGVLDQFQNEILVQLLEAKLLHLSDQVQHHPLQHWYKPTG